MKKEFNVQFDGLITKYTELLIGDTSEENIEKVKTWMMYTYMSKSMPALVKHWNEVTPTGKEEIMKLITEIKQLNDEHRVKKA